MFENVTETGTWMMCIFAVMIAVIAFLIYRQVKYVEKTSNIYTELLRLNARYHFHNGILREYRIDERVSAKSKFDRFDFDAELDKHISANLDHYLDLLKKFMQTSKAINSIYNRQMTCWDKIRKRVQLRKVCSMQRLKGMFAKSASCIRY